MAGRQAHAVILANEKRGLPTAFIAVKKVIATQSKRYKHLKIKREIYGLSIPYWNDRYAKSGRAVAKVLRAAAEKLEAAAKARKV